LLSSTNASEFQDLNGIGCFNMLKAVDFSQMLPFIADVKL
jgi:hypothetical protein